jgi:hypothetical protein
VQPGENGKFVSIIDSLRQMKRLQYLLDQALRTANMLDLNVQVMLRIADLALQVKALDSASARQYESFGSILRSTISDHRLLGKNINSIIARATILSNQVCDLASNPHLYPVD